MIASSSVSAAGTKDYKMVDRTWFANNALWDRYFFSTLSPHEGPLMGAKSLKQVSTGFLENGESLLNPRIIPADSKPGKEVVDRLGSADGFRESASHLMIDGAFNINSTSVQAWKALLASTNKEDDDYFHLSDGSINARFSLDSKNYTAAQAAADGHAFPEALEGQSAAGAPGYLTQGDILSSLGSVIAVRSDTFRIRSYGEAVDPSNKVIARAWCEAVVQRVPHFVDSENLPGTLIGSLKETNKRFGRRFEVAGFRWLSPEEV